MPDISEEQIAYLDKKLGLNLNAIQAVANDTKVYFAERCREEGLTENGMVTAIEAVRDSVHEAIAEAEAALDEGGDPDG